MRNATEEEREAMISGLFTPKMRGKRMAWVLDPTEHAEKVRAKEIAPDAWSITVKHDNGGVYVVRSAPCGLGCHCDAIAKRVSE